MGCEKQRRGGQQMKNGAQWQGNCLELGETVSYPLTKTNTSEQWNLLLCILSSPLVWLLLIVWKPFMKKKKIRFRGTSLLGRSQGKVHNALSFCVGRVHLTSEESVGITEPITSLASGASSRFCFKAVEHLGFVCVYLPKEGGGGVGTL